MPRIRHGSCEGLRFGRCREYHSFKSPLIFARVTCLRGQVSSSCLFSVCIAGRESGATGRLSSASLLLFLTLTTHMNPSQHSGGGPASTTRFDSAAADSSPRAAFPVAFSCLRFGLESLARWRRDRRVTGGLNGKGLRRSRLMSCHPRSSKDMRVASRCWPGQEMQRRPQDAGSFRPQPGHFHRHGNVTLAGCVCRLMSVSRSASLVVYRPSACRISGCRRVFGRYGRDCPKS